MDTFCSSGTAGAREARCHSRHRRTSWAWLPLWRPGGRRVAHFSERSCGLQSTVGPARVPPEPSQRLTNWNSIKSLPLSVLWFSPNAVHKGKGTFYLGSCELFFFFNFWLIFYVEIMLDLQNSCMQELYKDYPRPSAHTPQLFAFYRICLIISRITL